MGNTVAMIIKAHMTAMKITKRLERVFFLDRDEMRLWLWSERSLLLSGRDESVFPEVEARDR